MKRFTTLLLLAWVSLATAQQPVITDFTHDGALTWTNTQNTYCGIECKWNLGHTWLPAWTWGPTEPFWNTFMTETTGSVQMDLDTMWYAISGLNDYLPLGLQGFFFRVVSSASPLVPRLATNYVHVVNASTSVLTNVAIGLKDAGATVPASTNFPILAPSATTPRVAVWQEIEPGLGSLTNLIALSTTPLADGWYLSYDQDGLHHVVDASVFPFGTPNKNVDVTISNQSVTATFEWFSGTMTISY